jgi:hypothetical protein
MKTSLKWKAPATRALATLVAAAFLLPAGAYAQSMSPMRGKVTSFTDMFAVKVFPANPYNHRIKVEVKVYDADFRPVPAVISPSILLLAGNSSRQVTVMVPFGPDRQKRVRICTESTPWAQFGQNNIKAQICGKFIAQRR